MPAQPSHGIPEILERGVEERQSRRGGSRCAHRHLCSAPRSGPWLDVSETRKVACPYDRRMSHDEEVLGKAYDARLARRLLQYLRPYWRRVLLAAVAIVLGGTASLAQPYLIKVAIDRY